MNDCTKTILTIICAAALPALTAGAAAAQEAGGFSFGVTASTLGVGPEVGYRVSKSMGVRANATLFSISHNEDVNDINYDGKLKLKSGGAFLDIYPFGGGFRLTGGARLSDNKIRLIGNPGDIIEIGDHDYTPAEVGVLSGTVEAKSLAPYAGLGWGAGLGHGFVLTFDVGVMFQGRPRIDDLTATGTASGNPAFQQDLALEKADIENDINDFKYYPVVSIGGIYRF
jgi:hypothetical protein